MTPNDSQDVLPDRPPAPGRRPSRRVVVAAGSAAVVAAGAGGAVWWVRGRGDDGSGAERAAQDVATAWSGGTWGDVTFATGAAEVPADVGAEYARLVGALAQPAPQVSVASVDLDQVADGTATAQLDVSFDLAAGHGAPDGSVLAWTSTLRLARTGEGDDAVWQPLWEPALVHPDLKDGATFTVERQWASRAEVLGRDGTAIVTDTPVVQVGVQPSRTTDPAATAAALAAALGIDAGALTTRIQQASPDAFVDVITLRRSDYDAQRDVLQPLPGTVFREAFRPLAPTRGFARALLGSVGEVTAETIEGSGGRYAAGDLAGLSGLQARYDERLAGRVGLVVGIVGGTTAVSEELFRVDPSEGDAVRTSLDPAVQLAADETLTAATSSAALVAVDTATGEVLAVANSPVDGGDLALTGRFPPGSTFKVVTTLALLAGGLDPEETVACTPTYTVDGRSFSNFEDEAFGDVPFRTDFAMSCNTAFASLSPRLQDDTLGATALQLGIGAEWSTGVDAFAGDVPTAESAVDLAAASFGQGRTLVSPLAMAVAAASVAAGELRRPAIVLDPAPEPVPAPAATADPVALSTLAGLMRDVVTSGTATVLDGVPGDPVHAKTGTAEYGTGDPLPTHAWVIGFQGTLAFAVFVSEGSSGGAVAAPLAADFLRRTTAL